MRANGYTTYPTERSYNSVLPQPRNTVCSLAESIIPTEQGAENTPFTILYFAAGKHKLTLSNLGQPIRAALCIAAICLQAN